jgi:hypothetical protein
MRQTAVIQINRAFTALSKVLLQSLTLAVFAVAHKPYGSAKDHAALFARSAV